MGNKQLFGFPISLKRASLDGTEKDLLIELYVHKKNKREFVTGPGRRGIHLIFEQIESEQPVGLSDNELIEYFGREMNRKGFRKVVVPPGLMKIQPDYSYTYLSKK